MYKFQRFPTIYGLGENFKVQSHKHEQCYVQYIHVCTCISLSLEPLTIPPPKKTHKKS